jgi:3-oxoacyl-[acyl-carrier protein] reductase
METILIVGIQGSIGRAVSALFSGHGIECIGTTSRKMNPSLDQKRLLFVDLEEQNSIEALASKVPPLSGIVFCGGIEPQRALNDTNRAHHLKMMDIHVSGPLMMVRCLKGKLARGGCIIFISSVAAQRGSYDPSYAIAKAAVGGMTKTLARELSADEIRVNAIAPGLIEETPVYERMTLDFRQKHMNESLTKRLTTTADCADAIYFLYTQKQITGQVLHINGGQYFAN